VSVLFYRGLVVGPVPANTVPPTISGTQRVGSTLVALTGSWTNAPTSYSFQWRSAATIGGTYSDIGGATDQAYVPVSGDLGRFVEVVVTAANASGSAAATSAPAGPIAAALVPATPHLSAARPSMIYELDLGSALSGSGSSSWTDATSSLRDAIQTKRGRANLLDKVESGTGDFPVDNADRRYEPEYAASPLYPNVTADARQPVSAPYGSTHLPGSTAATSTAGRSPGRPSNALRASISSNDGFTVLSAPRVTPQVYAFRRRPAPMIADDPRLRSGSRRRCGSLDDGAETMLGIDDRQDPRRRSNSIQEIRRLRGSACSSIDGAGYADLSRPRPPDPLGLLDRRPSRRRSADIAPSNTGELPYLVPSPDYDVSSVYNDVEVSSGLATPTTLPAIDAVDVDSRNTGIRTLDPLDAPPLRRRPPSDQAQPDPRSPTRTPIYASRR
jgi:hypothetical protein